MSLHSSAITTNFDEAADISCWHYFFYTYIWFSNSMSATCSSSHKLTLVMFLILFSFSSYFWTSLVLFCLIALGLFHCWHYLMPLCCPYVFSRFWQNLIILHQHLVLVALTSAKLVLRTTVMSFYIWLSLLLRLQIIASKLLSFALVCCRSDWLNVSQ